MNKDNRDQLWSTNGRHRPASQNYRNARWAHEVRSERLPLSVKLLIATAMMALVAVGYYGGKI